MRLGACSLVKGLMDAQEIKFVGCHFIKLSMKASARKLGGYRASM